MQKKLSRYSPPPLQTSKKFRVPPLFAMKITGQPHRKACKLNFYWLIFFKPPLQGQKFKGPLFASGPSNMCLSLKFISTGKFVVFFQGPLTRVKNFKGLPFCISPPPPPLQVFVNDPQNAMSLGVCVFWNWWHPFHEKSVYYCWKIKPLAKKKKKKKKEEQSRVPKQYF